jgi:hypothetical protein
MSGDYPLTRASLSVDRGQNGTRPFFRRTSHIHPNTKIAFYAQSFWTDDKAKQHFQILIQSLADNLCARTVGRLTTRAHLFPGNRPGRNAGSLPSFLFWWLRRCGRWLLRLGRCIDDRDVAVVAGCVDRRWAHYEYFADVLLLWVQPPLWMLIVAFLVMLVLAFKITGQLE